MSDSWHWKTKDCLPWTKEWLKEKLVGLQAQEEGWGRLEVEKVENVDGDVDLSQRKGKLRTIYDYSFELEWKGDMSQGDKRTGRVTIPEVSHDMTQDEFQFHLRSHDNDAESERFEKLFRSAIEPKIASILGGFGTALSETHGPDFLEKSAGTAPAAPATVHGKTNGSTTSSLPATAAPSAPKIAKNGNGNVNTTTVTKEVELAAPADVLWDLFFDPNKIPLWSRAPAKIDVAAPGSPFELFHGAVSGSMVESQKPKSVVQKWRIESWPEGHLGTLQTQFLQGSNTTQVRMTLEGVPVGEGDSTEEKIEQFIFRPLKMMGLGTIL